MLWMFEWLQNTKNLTALFAAVTRSSDSYNA